jgi:aryl-alcohol dehydrogenase-like predicted oxidoreductase
MATLTQRTLGRTGVEVGVLGYGGMELWGEGFRGKRGATRSEARAVIGALLESGINFIDTAPDYGSSEDYLGEFLAGRRDEVFLASKCGCKVDPESLRLAGQIVTDHDFSRAVILAGVERSLRRLRTDHLDLLQFHMNPSLGVLQATDAIETVLEMKQQGKVRFLGCSSSLPELEDHLSLGVFDVFQIPYSGLDREHEGAISRAAAAGAGIVVRGGFGKGSASAQIRSAVNAHRISWETYEAADLSDLCDGMSRLEFMLRFAISHPDVTTAIVGTMFVDELQEDVRIAEKGPLTPGVYTAAKERLSSMGSVPGK